jgi:hypothetical protein
MEEVLQLISDLAQMINKLTDVYGEGKDKCGIFKENVKLG